MDRLIDTDKQHFLFYECDLAGQCGVSVTVGTICCCRCDGYSWWMWLYSNDNADAVISDISRKCLLHTCFQQICETGLHDTNLYVRSCIKLPSSWIFSEQTCSKTAVQIPDGCCEEQRVDVSWNNTLNQHALYVYRRSACSVTQDSLLRFSREESSRDVCLCGWLLLPCAKRKLLSQWTIPREAVSHPAWLRNLAFLIHSRYTMFGSVFFFNNLTASLSRLLYVTWHAR